MIEIRQDMRATVDALYESGIEFSLFDRRVVLPWEQIPPAVNAETGEEVSFERLEEMAKDGLIPIGEAADGGRGVCLYLPSRIGLFLKFERDGYALRELKLLAEYEEWLVEGVLTVDDLSYEDDDRQLLLNLCEDQIDSLETQIEYPRDEADAQRAAAQLEQWRSSKDLIERIPLEQLTTEGREQIRRQAYLRPIHERDVSQPSARRGPCQSPRWLFANADRTRVDVLGRGRVQLQGHRLEEQPQTTLLQRNGAATSCSWLRSVRRSGGSHSHIHPLGVPETVGRVRTLRVPARSRGDSERAGVLALLQGATRRLELAAAILQRLVQGGCEPEALSSVPPGSRD